MLNFVVRGQIKIIGAYDYQTEMLTVLIRTQSAQSNIHSASTEQLVTTLIKAL